MKIVIVGHSYDTERLHVDGLSGTLYNFDWNKGSGRYVCEIADQDAADDLFNAQTPDSMFKLVPWVEGAGTPGASKPKPIFDRRNYSDLEPDELAKLARECGLDASPSEPKDVLMRVIGAYAIGAGWKQENPGTDGEELIALRARVVDLERELAQADAKAELAEATADEPAAESQQEKPKRGSRSRKPEVQPAPV